MTKVTYVSCVEQWNSIIIEHDVSKNIIVLCCSTKWCGPCKALAPKYEELANNYDDDVLFLKCDIDECEEIANKFDVSSIPTTLIIKDCKVAKRVEGASVSSIQLAIESLQV